MASTGHSSAKGPLQPTGRPVMGMTCRPLALSCVRASSASGVIAPSVVSVSSMSVKTPSNCRRASAGHEASAGRAANRLHRLKPHDDDKGPVCADELDLALELRKVDHARAYERIEDRASTHHHLVVRRIDGKVFRPEPFQRRDITRQGGGPFLVVERADALFVRVAILCHGELRKWHAEQQQEC